MEEELILCKLIFSEPLDEEGDKNIIDILHSYYFDLLLLDDQGVHFYGFFESEEEMHDNLKDSLIELEAEDPEFSSSLIYKGFINIADLNMKEF